jgi:hypothetical protein
MQETAIEQLLAKQAITEVLYLYALGRTPDQLYFKQPLLAAA